MNKRPILDMLYERKSELQAQINRIDATIPLPGSSGNAIYKLDNQAKTLHIKELNFIDNVIDEVIA